MSIITGFFINTSNRKRSYRSIRFFQMSIVILLVFIPFIVQSQSLSKKVQKSWIKIGMENLSHEPIEPDTLYTRYSFDEKNVNISFYPAWTDYRLQWSILSNFSLTIGFETYILEELTDSTLVFSKEEFRRFRFVSETQYSKLKKPDTTQPLNDKPVYIASNYLTPRYKNKVALNHIIQTKLEEVYSVKDKITFVAKFIVTDQGKIEHVQIINGISTDFDNEFIKQIKKTSKDWYPAKIDSIPVNCEMSFIIEFLGSLNPNFGILK